MFFGHKVFRDMFCIQYSTGCTAGLLIHCRCARIFGQMFDNILGQIFDQGFGQEFLGQNI